MGRALLLFVAVLIILVPLASSGSDWTRPPSTTTTTTSTSTNYTHLSNFTNDMNFTANNTGVVFLSVGSEDWSNVSITESQISDLAHTVDSLWNITGYITNDGGSLNVNETKMNTTIDGRYVEPHKCTMYRNAAFSYVGGWKNITLDAISINVGSMCSLAQGHVIVQRSGYYRITGSSVQIQDIGSGKYLDGYISVNGTRVRVVSNYSPIASGSLSVYVFHTAYLGEGSTVEYGMLSNAATPFDTETNLEYRPQLSVIEIR